MLNTDNKIDSGLLEKLSPEEKKAALEILKQYSSTGKSDIYDELKYADYEEIPVDIDTFIDDRNYLGDSFWSVDEFTGEKKCSLFPYWRKVLHKLFPDNISTAFNTVIFTGGIGLGKSTCAGVAQLYMLYRMLCLKDPCAHYRIQPGSSFTFSQLNVTLEAAHGVLWQKTQAMLQASPWFMEHGYVNASKTEPIWQPNGSIELLFVSSNRNVIGRNLFCLDGDTVIKTEDGDKQLKTLVGKDIRVYSIDDNNGLVLSEKCTVKPTAKTSEEYQIELENGTIIKCTPEHRLMLKDGTYKMAKDLSERDELAEF